MKISENMDLYGLMEAMGNLATPEDAEALRNLLVERHEGKQTGDIDENEWLDLISQVARNAAREN